MSLPGSEPTAQGGWLWWIRLWNAQALEAQTLEGSDSGMQGAGGTSLCSQALCPPSRGKVTVGTPRSATCSGQAFPVFAMFSAGAFQLI